MANEFINAERVVRAALGMLEREVVLPRLVWRDAGGSFVGAKDDTISIRVPAFTTARTRALRGAAGVAAPTGRQIIIDELGETKVDLTLDTDVYKAVAVTDEEMTLDIVDFGTQVLQPVVASVARGIEDALATEMTSATYEHEVDFDAAEPYRSILDARKLLSDSNVPMGGRALLLGSSVELELLDNELLKRVDASGTDDALREARIGRIAGFDTYASNAIPEDEAYAFHRTAYVLSMQAPIVPAGASWGATESFAGLSMRALRDYDFANVRDRLVADVFVGTNVVTDRGEVDETTGKFTPDGTAEPVFVRAVKLTLGGS